MERNNLKNHQSIVGRSMKEPINMINKNKVRETREYCTSYESYYSGDLLSGYLWNPRSYTCSFCKREFNSAQALGGHMNVHRRERARLRQYHPLLFLNLNSNSNPNSFLSSKFSFPAKKLSQSSVVLPQIETEKCVIKSSSYNYKSEEDFFRVLKNAQVIRLDLENGLISGEKEGMDLDLELRLGG